MWHQGNKQAFQQYDLLSKSIVTTDKLLTKHNFFTFCAKVFVFLNQAIGCVQIYSFYFLKLSLASTHISLKSLLGKKIALFSALCDNVRICMDLQK